MFEWPRATERGPGKDPSSVPERSRTSFAEMRVAYEAVDDETMRGYLKNWDAITSFQESGEGSREDVTRKDRLEAQMAQLYSANQNPDSELKKAA